MKIISKTKDLQKFCDLCAHQPFVTVDTEFLRERTYYSKLCLVQLAYPEEGPETAVLIDPLAETLSLDPLYALFQNKRVVKVFHAARQDIEIFFTDRGIMPDPLFDTQIAAMVCGYGEQVGYETLVRQIVGKPLDKSSRFTDWSIRPLSERQQTYAVADVTHLRVIYAHLQQQLAQTGRTAWVEEELAVLTDAETYRVDPDLAWTRVKSRNSSGKMLCFIRELARFRETYAQTKNIPRNRVFKDDALLELAATKPMSLAQLKKSRLLLRDARKGAIAEGILDAIRKAGKIKSDNYPKPSVKSLRKQGHEGLSELLRVLLKACADRANVAGKLICSTSDLDAIAAGDRASAVFTGWRYEIFGQYAQKLCDGKIALSASKNTVKLISL